MSDELLFAEEEDEQVLSYAHEPYKILVVDDEPEVHKVTELALTGFRFEGSRLEFFHADSATEARVLLRENPDVAVILLDVVMETELAGLNLVDVIRTELNMKSVRIVLRTGQPGQAPEQDVIVKYDINDYKSKIELTSQKLFTLMHASLRSYRDILNLERSKKGLRQVIEASKGIFDKRVFESFITGALDQLTHLLNLDDAFIMSHDIGVFKFPPDEQDLFETYDRFGHKDKVKVTELAPDLKQVIDKAIAYQENIYSQNYVTLYCRTKFYITLFVITPRAELSLIDKELINIFSENITIGLENIHLGDEIRANQKEMVYRIGEIVETRSKETGHHVKRVALYSELLARYYGLSEDEVECIKLASPLHDIGKVAIPDSILNKPGKLSEEEWALMQTHAKKGGEMLQGSDQKLLQVGAVLAATHHEKWDGSGYPDGLKGEAIPISGRITALADVFDALSNTRCYKPAWPVEKVTELVRSESGKHFDPKLAGILLDNLHEFLAINQRYQDKKSSQ